MIRIISVAILAAALLPAAPPAGPASLQSAVMKLEKSIDARFTKLTPEEPFDLLGATRGVYIEGYGVVFTTELSLITTPSVTPFRPVISKEEVIQLHRAKLRRLPLLRQIMREALVFTASSLEGMPPNEQVTVAVRIFYYSWEDKTGLPSQIIMQAPRSSLAGKAADARLEASIRVQEL
jgi:hypothetical protein